MKNLIFAACLALSIMSTVSFSQDAAEAKSVLPVFAVDSIAFATGVESRVPVGVATEFVSDVGNVSCWTRISSTEAPVSMKHIWYKDGAKVFEYSLTLKGTSGRMWSTKSVTTGSWKVDVLDDNGARVKSGTFTVK